jgi:hypothetical protein
MASDKRNDRKNITLKKEVVNRILMGYMSSSRRGSSVGIASAYGLDGPGIEFRWG